MAETHFISERLRFGRHTSDTYSIHANNICDGEMNLGTEITRRKEVSGATEGREALTTLGNHIVIPTATSVI